MLGLSRGEASVLSICLTCLRMPCITALYYPVMSCGGDGDRGGGELDVWRKRRRGVEEAKAGMIK